MRRLRRVLAAITAVAVLALIGYTGYVGYEGSRQLVEHTAELLDCRTPDLQFGWSYQAINYDVVDDGQLPLVNKDMRHCADQGTKAGSEVVTQDGIRLAGWYIPAANGAGPTAPTIVLMHGFAATKSGILKYAAGLHASFNLVAFDQRNEGRSTGIQTTGGVREATDLHTIIDWLVRTKHPASIGVLGNSLGAVGALSEAGSDSRVGALALDSMHTRTSYQVEQRLMHAGHPMYPGTWAIFAGTWVRTGLDVGAVDPEITIEHYGDRPLLLIHGTADTEDLPERTQSFSDHARSLGVPVELHWCEGAGHNAAGMPVDLCREEFATWVRDFFSRTLQPVA